MNIEVLIFFKRIYGLLVSFPFWMMTFLCNLVVAASSIIFYLLEHIPNSRVNHFIDAVWWSFSTITTVGYGDITPVTFWGKILGITLMIVGTGLFVSYTALFANAMLGKEFSRLGKRVKAIQTDLHEEEENLERQIGSLNRTLARLEIRLKNLEKRD